MKAIGIAGTDEKFRWVERIGGAVCLIAQTEGFVEVYFGEMVLR